MKEELLDQICKFKIGDVLTFAIEEKMPTNERTLLRVSERLIQQCEGGVQIHYDCRIHKMERIWGTGGTPMASWGDNRSPYNRVKEGELVLIDMDAYAASLEKPEKK